ncbi:MAG: hypothetical protein JW849_00445 [Phycisphaerae bacterium]|nr:hypothetical protein [Phycisphaerae bacterium]
MWPINNPLIYRGVRSSFGRSGFWGWMLGLGLFMGFIFVCIYIDASEDVSRHLTHGNQVSLSQLTGYRYAWFCFGLELFVAIFVTLWIMGDSVVQERKQNTHEFLETLPLHPLRKALGLLLGRCTWALIVVALAGAVGTISALIGEVEMERILWLHAIALSGFIASGFLGLLASLGLGRMSLGGLAAIVFLLLSMGISSALLGEKTVILPLLPLAPLACLGWSMIPVHELPPLIQQNAFHFYSLPVPWQAGPVAFYLFLAVVFFLSAGRGLARPDAARSPRWQGLIGLALFHGLLVGFLADNVRRAAEVCLHSPNYSSLESAEAVVAICLAYLAGFGAVILLWMILQTPTMDKAAAWMRHRPRGPRGNTIVRGLFDDGSPSWFAGLLIWGITLAVTLAINQYFFQARISARVLLAVAGVWALFLLGYASLFQAGVLTSRLAGFLVGILFIAACLLGPSLLAMVTESISPLYATPVGMLEHIEDLVEPSSAQAAKEAWIAVMKNAFSGLIILVIGQGLCALRLATLGYGEPSARENRQADGAAAS